MRTAVTDGIISSSPCKIEGAGTEHAAERPIASAEEIELLSEAMPEHLRIVVPLPPGARCDEARFSDCEEWMLT